MEGEEGVDMDREGKGSREGEKAGPGGGNVTRERLEECYQVFGVRVSVGSTVQRTSLRERRVVTEEEDEVGNPAVSALVRGTEDELQHRSVIRFSLWQREGSPYGNKHVKNEALCM